MSVTQSRPRAGQWQAGQSGNPGGKPKGLNDVGALARVHTAAAIEALAKALNDPKTAVPAATVLLNRGWGQPLQKIEADAPSALAMHLLAAQIVSQHLADTRQAPPPATQIEGVPVTGNLLDAPQPTE